MEFLLSVPYLPYIVGALILFFLYPRFARSLRGGRALSFDDVLGSLLGPSYAESRLMRDVERLKRRGDHLLAGKMLEDQGKLEQAAQVFAQGQEHFAAASVLERMGRHDRAAEMYLQAGDHKKAAEEFAVAGKAARAAALFLEKGNNLEAAKAFGAAGMWDRAAELFARSGFAQRAAEAWEKAGEPLKAAEHYERHYLENVSYGTTYSATAVSPDQKSAQRAGQLYLRAGEPSRAVEVLVRGGYFHEAAEAAQQNRDFARAAELFLRADEPERAAEAHDLAGNPVAAASLRGEVALKKDRPAEAAALFQKGRDFLRAAELFESVGMMAEAAGAFEAGESHAAAGGVYLRAGLRDKAAASYEKAGEWETAARLFEELGQPARAAQLFERAGQTYRSGQMAARAGDTARAITLLQRVGPDEEDFVPATRVLAELFVATGRPELARERLQKVLGSTPIGPGNLDLYYWLATAHEACGETAEALAMFRKLQAEDVALRDVGERVRRLEATVVAAAPAAATTPAPAAPSPQASPSTAPAAAAPVAAPPSAVPTRRGTATGSAAGAVAPRFTLREEIGRGPLGVVHRGEEPSGRSVALRLLPEHLTADRTLMTAVAADLDAASKLSNPHLAKVLAVVELTPGQPCVVGELVNGKNLAGPLQAGARMGLQQVHSLGRVLAQTLVHVHGHGLVHGSVQPSNVMVASGTVKLTDLGLGRLAQLRRPAETWRAAGLALDVAGDLYDLASLMYNLLTGVHPRTLPQGAALPLPSTIVQNVPESMDRLLVRCLHPRQELRLVSAEALLAELRDMVRLG